ncbi:MAG: hypothetical protein ACE5ET_03590, partial [Gammaproteobacteria bacterium]
ASDPTWSFKTAVILALEDSGLGCDTRYRYYRQQFPEMAQVELARMVCDPMEYYDRDWPAYRAGMGAKLEESEAATRFMLTLDDRFRAEARAAIYCFDEAGFGSGVNAMRFLTCGKPLLGFYNPEVKTPTLNLSNILQLQLEFPRLVTLIRYADNTEIPPRVLAWLKQLGQKGAPPHGQA